VGGLVETLVELVVIDVVVLSAVTDFGILEVEVDDAARATLAQKGITLLVQQIDPYAWLAACTH
jgi:hypothetical protein